MKMCYDGALVMPMNYSVMDEDEMMYVEGGGRIAIGVTIKEDSFIIGALSCIGGAITQKKAAIALAEVAGSIIAAIELGTAGIATVGLGIIIAAVGAFIPMIAGYTATYGINALKGKTFVSYIDIPFVKSRAFNVHI